MPGKGLGIFHLRYTGIDYGDNEITGCTRGYAGTEMLPWLHEIPARSLVLTGELDGGCNPRLNRLIADALSDAELVILPGIKHALLLEAPDQVAAHLIRFIGA